MTYNQKIIKKVSMDMGLGGEVTDEVHAEVARRERMLSTPLVGDKVELIDGWHEGVIVKKTGTKDNPSYGIVKTGGQYVVGNFPQDFLLKKSLDFHRDMELIDE